MSDIYLLIKTKNYKLAIAISTGCCRLNLFSASFILSIFFALYFSYSKLKVHIFRFILYAFLYSFLRRCLSIRIYFILLLKILLKGALNVIDYFPFWQTLEKSTENWYTLTNKHHLSHSTLHRLKHNKDVSTKTLNDLCRILDCDIKDIVRYIPSDKDQKL